MLAWLKMGPDSHQLGCVDKIRGIVGLGGARASESESYGKCEEWANAAVSF